MPTLRLSMILALASSLQRWSIGSPSRWTTPSTPVEGLCGRPFQGRLPAEPDDAGPGAAGALGVAGEADHLVAAGQQGVTQRRADQAAGSGDEDLHAPGGSTVAKVPVSSLCRAIPSRLASSTTASATFGATSRLNTLGMM